MLIYMTLLSYYDNSTIYKYVFTFINILDERQSCERILN